MPTIKKIQLERLDNHCSARIKQTGFVGYGENLTESIGSLVKKYAGELGLEFEIKTEPGEFEAIIF